MAVRPKVLRAEQTHFPTTLVTHISILFIGLEYKVLGEKLLGTKVNNTVVHNLE
jgi:hypothetical protein